MNKTRTDGFTMDYVVHYESPLGGITLSSDGEFLTGLWFDGQKHFALTIDKEYLEREVPVLKETRKWLDEYFSGRDPGPAPAVKLQGTDFRMRVWGILQTIPFGKTMTYGDIAELIAKEQNTGSMSAQAVGGAVGHNPVSIVVPCHRVIGSDGSLMGYAGGTDRKKQLLEIEGTIIDVSPGSHL